jgi:hypothetical protein
LFNAISFAHQFKQMDLLRYSVTILQFLHLQAKLEPMRFQNPSVNNKLLRTPSVLSLTVESTSLSSHDQDEEQLELLCKPVKEFLGKLGYSPTSF